MIDKVDIVARNYANMDCPFETMHEMLKNTYVDGFKRGVEKERKRQRWIPCEEQLPEKGQTVLVTFSGLDVETNLCKCNMSIGELYGVDDDNTCWMINTPYDFNTDDIEITAWRPLPEPYKEQEES